MPYLMAGFLVLSWKSKGSSQAEKRGRREPKDKTPEEVVQSVQAAIQSFPTESS